MIKQNWTIPGFIYIERIRKLYLEGKNSSIIFLRHNGMENEKDVVEVWPEMEKFGRLEK